METIDVIRLAVFLGALFVFSALEALFPRRRRVQPRLKRWATNISLVVLGSLSLQLLGPLIALSIAAWAIYNGWGLFNITDWPFWLEFIMAFVVLDFTIWLQHVMFHKIPWLWRLHRVHHADRDLDASSGVRFHPGEFLISMLYKCAVVLLLGPALLTIIVFEIVLNATAIFNHANLALPKNIDSFLRKIIVTPDMHRVHHSIILSESQKNYGFNFSIWDRVFKTYQAKPEKGHKNMTLGLETAQSPHTQNLDWALLFPFK